MRVSLIERRTSYSGRSNESSGYYRHRRFSDRLPTNDDLESDMTPVEPEVGPKVICVSEPEEGSDSSDASFPPSDEEPQRFTNEFARLPGYWQIQKLVKYVKTGDQTATNVALCMLLDHDLSLEPNQTAIGDVPRGLEVLVNLLEAEHHGCRSGSLKVLIEISAHEELRLRLIDLGVISLLLDQLSVSERELQLLAMETIAKLGVIRRASRYVRKLEGIPKLINVMDVSQKVLDTHRDSLNEEGNEEVDVARACAHALMTLTKSKKNIEYMRRGGLVAQLMRYTRSVHADVVEPTLGVLAQCAHEPKFQLAIDTEDIIPELVRYLKEKDKNMVRHAAQVLFSCSETESVHDQVRRSGGLDNLVKLYKDKTAMEDKKIMAAVTGAVWKCAVSPANRERLDRLKVMDVLVPLLQEDDDEVLTNCAGAISEMCGNPDNFDILRSAKGMDGLVNMLHGIYEPMLINACIVLAKCAENPECLKEMEDLDAPCFIWSLLKNRDEEVQAEAAWALCPWLRNGTDTGELVRTLRGGLELVVDLLTSQDDYVLAAICATIAEIAEDTENLAVLTDLGVIPLLAALVQTEDELLRCNLARAIATCCKWGTNCSQFGKLDIIRHLVEFCFSEDASTKEAVTLTIHQLSTNPRNCIDLHNWGVVRFLLRQIASEDVDVQYAAAGALSNMRKLALAAEKYKYSHVMSLM